MSSVKIVFDWKGDALCFGYQHRMFIVFVGQLLYITFTVRLICASDEICAGRASIMPQSLETIVSPHPRYPAVVDHLAIGNRTEETKRYSHMCSIQRGRIGAFNLQF